jgi:uncharacterized protein (TIGR02452 family)
MSEIKNIEVFNDTLRRCQHEYLETTKKCIESTIFYPNPSKSFYGMRGGNSGGVVLFENGGSVSTAYREAKHSKVALLDFADGLKPGGWPEQGASTQEENICRCTNLFEVLVEHSEYYKQNKTAPSDICTDGILYVPDATIFKNDVSYARIQPRCTDVIVCPAPKGHKLSSLDILTKRATGIVQSAVKNKAEVLILGAWGCGAFGQSPLLVGTAFATALNKYNHFKKVIFVFRPTPGWGEDSNFSGVLGGFSVEYKGDVYGKY